VEQGILIVQLLLLLAVANGTPVFAAKILGKENAVPLDGNAFLSDGRRLFGSSKTIRGVLLSILLTTLCAPLVGLEIVAGFVVGSGAMIGDLFSSFVKRRLGMSASSKFMGLDQIPESFFPLLASMAFVPLAPLSVAIGTILFFLGAVVLSRVFFNLNIRDRPY
jgi:CDP-archaeol synthase